jgi:XTP/dITP diphosphohydrolase
MHLFFNTTNASKLEEINTMAALLGLNIYSAQELGTIPATEEHGKDFKENALLKAQTVYRLHKVNVFAEDSGLEVDALGNAPGVYSARYAGPQSDDLSNNRLLLANMEGIMHRKARFVTAIALIYQGKNYFFEGSIEGTIAREMSGAYGFGYDPLFVPVGYAQSFSELGPAVKNKISHRSLAFEKLIDFLKNL